MSHDEPPLSVAEAATIRALLDASVAPDEVFRDRSVTPDEWPAAEERLLGVIADAVDRGELAAMEEYQEVYRAVRAQHDEEFEREAAVGSIGISEGEPSSTLDAPVVPLAQATFQQKAAAAPFDPDATAEADVRAVLAGLRNRGVPFDPSVAAPKPLPSEPADDAQSGATEELDLRAFRSVVQAVPFASPSPAPRTQEFDPDETAMLDGSKVLAGLRNGGIPFNPATVGSPLADEKTLSSEVEAEIDPKEETGTEELDLSLLHVERALPFGSDGSEKIDLSGVANEFQPPTAEDFELTVEEFAQIQTALSLSRGLDEVLQRFGIDANDWVNASKRMLAWLDADRQLRNRYEELYREALKNVR